MVIYGEEIENDMWFNLPLPPGINQTYKTNKNAAFYKSEKVKEWETEAGWIIKQQWKNTPAIKKNCRVYINLFLTRDRDIDSTTKLVFDLLQRQRVIENDSLIVESTQEKHHIIKGETPDIKPHIDVMVEEVE